MCLKVGGNNEFESDKCSRLSFESENANSKYLVAIHIAECQAFGFMIQIAAHTEGPAWFVMCNMCNDDWKYRPQKVVRKMSPH